MNVGGYAMEMSHSSQNAVFGVIPKAVKPLMTSKEDFDAKFSATSSYVHLHVTSIRNHFICHGFKTGSKVSGVHQEHKAAGAVSFRY